MERLKGKVAIVTGAASGIGAETARLFVAEGACVLLTDISEKAGVAIADRLGDRAHFFRHDVTAESDWISAVAVAEERFGTVTTLFNNAGISETGASVADLTKDQFCRTIEVNLVSVFLGTRSVVPAMRKGGGGSIINTSSVAGLVGVGSAAAYVASKFGVTGLTKAAAIDLGAIGIRVNSLHPGLVETAMVAAMPDKARAGAADFARSLPLGRMGQPLDIAKMAVFLASDESAFSTGGAFVADGGWTAA